MIEIIPGKDYWKREKSSSIGAIRRLKMCRKIDKDLLLAVYNAFVQHSLTIVVKFGMYVFGNIFIKMGWQALEYNNEKEKWSLKTRFRFRLLVACSDGLIILLISIFVQIFKVVGADIMLSSTFINIFCVFLLFPSLFHM